MLLYRAAFALAGGAGQARVGRRSLSTMADLTDKEQLQSLIKSTPLLVFSKTTCGFCARLNQALQTLQTDPAPHIVQLNQLQGGSKVQAHLAALTNQRTVPSLFVGSKHVGGCSDAMALLATGKLQSMLVEAGVSVGHDPSQSKL